jgi:hypothetical protein
VKKQKGEVGAFLFVIELGFLKGRSGWWVRAHRWKR